MEKEIKPEETAPVNPPEKEAEDIFEVNEIEIEEMAIDGVCGVY